MTEPFIASNGIEITMDPDREGKVYLVGRRSRGDEGQYLGTHATASPKGIVALREFFQHERDEELGRWRWPERPHYVAYARGADSVRIIDERTGRAQEFDRYGESAWVMEDAANAYFEAHPERKPWHSAKPGEIWVLTIDDSEQVVSAVQQYEKVFNPISHPIYATFANGSERITAGRRIWPEDAS